MIVEQGIVDPQVEKMFREWQGMKRRFAVLDLVARKVAARIGELEGDLTGFIKQTHEQQFMIDDALAQYNTKKHTSTKYASVFKKALEIATADQKKILEEYKEAQTTRSVIDSVKIVDPNLESFLTSLNKMPTDQLLGLMKDVQDIPDVVPKTSKAWEPTEQMSRKTEGVFSSMISKIKAGFKSLISALSGGQKSASNLLQVASGAEATEDVKRLNLPTNIPNKIDVSIGNPGGGHDQRPQESKKTKVDGLLKVLEGL